MRVWIESNQCSLFWEMRQWCLGKYNNSVCLSQFSRACVGMRVCANDHRRSRWYALTVFWQNSSAMSKHIELQMRGLCALRRVVPCFLCSLVLQAVQAHLDVRSSADQVHAISPAPFSAVSVFLICPRPPADSQNSRPPVPASPARAAQ